MGDRTFKPLVIQTKQELLTALRKGKLKSAKYNLLNDEEKEFVELVVFGDMTREQAINQMYPGMARAGKIRGNRILANPDVGDAMAELSTQKDKSFMSELMSARDLALEKLMYIMQTAQDPALQAACAKTVLEASGKVIKDTLKSDDRVGGIRFEIASANFHVEPTTVFKKEEPVIIEEVERADKPASPPEVRLFYEGVDNYNAPPEKEEDEDK